MLFIAAGLILFLMAAFRGNIDDDYHGYVEFYEEIDKMYLEVEPTFVLIANFVKSAFNNILFVFIIYAMIAVSIKLYAISLLTEFRLQSLVVYFSFFFLLHEMTQMRAAVASGMLLVCLYLLKNKKYIYYALLTALAICFHYSAIAILFLPFLSRDRVSKLYYLLIPLGYLLAFAHIGLTNLLPYLFIPIELVQLKFSSYQELDAGVNLFNLVLLLRIALAYLLIWKADLLQQHNPYSALLIKTYVIGIFLFLFFSDIWGIATRLSELFQITEIILLPFMLYMFKNKYVANGLVIIITISFLSFLLLKRELLKSYF